MDISIIVVAISIGLSTAWHDKTDVFVKSERLGRQAASLSCFTDVQGDTSNGDWLKLGRHRFSKSELVTTLTLLIAMAAPARVGLR